MDILHLHTKIYNQISRFVFEHKTQKNILSSYILQSKTYHECRKTFPQAKSQMTIKAIQAVIANYKTIKKQLKSNGNTMANLEKQSTMKKHAMRLDKRIYNFLPNNKISITTLERRAIVSFEPYMKFKEMLQNYTLLDPLIFENAGQLWLSVSFEIPCPLHIPERASGIDLGLKRLATTSEGMIIQGNDFLKHKRRMRFLKRQLKRKNKGQSEADKRPFVFKSNSARKLSQKLKCKEHNFSKNYIHHLANSLLIKTKGNVLVMEDLSGIKFKTNARRAKQEGRPKDGRNRKFNNRNSQVPYYMLRQIMTYKAPPVGKRVVTVDPRNTSKNDSTGGEMGMRKGCRYITKNDRQLDADHNAACNIAMRYALPLKLPVSSVPAFAGMQTIWAGCMSTSPMFLA